MVICMSSRPWRLTHPLDYVGPNPSGLCMCGCGQPTTLARNTNSKTGAVAGKPQRYVAGHQRRISPVDYIVDPETGCWIYQQHIGKWGYGIKRCPRRKRQTAAHIVYWEAVNGPVPEGMVLDHECHNRDLTCPGGRTDCMHRRCVNPDHVRAVTEQVNILAGRSIPAANAVKEFCDHGHEFTPMNTYHRPDRTGRQCRACKRNRDAEYRRNYQPKGRAASPPNCPSGHEFTPENTGLSKQGWRFCRACHRLKAKAQARARKAAAVTA